MKTITVPQKDQVSEGNSAIFSQMEKGLGFVPNLFATFAHSNNALKNYLNFQNAKTSLNSKEKEVINLVVSQYNDCQYCLAAHTAIAQKIGFSLAQTLEIRSASLSFNTKLDAMAKLVKSIITQKGHGDNALLEQFFNVGYTEETLIDVILLIGDKTITNYVHAITKVPIDWPLAPELITE